MGLCRSGARLSAAPGKHDLHSRIKPGRAGARKVKLKLCRAAQDVRKAMLAALPAARGSAPLAELVERTRDVSDEVCPASGCGDLHAPGLARMCVHAR